MSLLPGLTEFNNHGIEVFNNDLYRVHRCFQDAVTRPVKNEDERKALIKAAFQFEERGLNRIADEFRAKHTHRLFPTAVGSLCAAVSRLAPPEIQPDAWILSTDELALWDSYNLPACNLRLSPNQNYLSEVAPLAVFSPPAWTPEYRRSLDLAQRRSLSAKKARPPPSESSEVEIEAVPPIKKPRLSSSAKRTSTTEPETASEDGVDNAAEDDEEEDDSGESEVDELRSSPPVPMTRPTRGRARGSGRGRGRGRVEVIIPNWPRPKPLPKPAPSRRSTTIREDDERPSPSVPLTVEGRPTTRSTTAGSSKAPPASSKNTVSEKGKGRAVSISPPPAKKNIQRRHTDMESHDVKHPLARSSVEVPYRFNVPRGEAFSLRDILESGRSMKVEMRISCLTCIIARVECNYVGRSDKCARCKTYRYLCDWILPQDEAFSQMDQVRAWGAPTPGHFHERMVELTWLLETQDRLSATIRSLADTLSLTRKSITDKESEIRQIATNPKIVLEYLQLHAEGLQLSRESIRGLGCLFEWPLEFNFAEDFREVSVQGSQTVFRNLKTQETFSVDLSGYSIRRPEFSPLHLRLAAALPGVAESTSATVLEEQTVEEEVRVEDDEEVNNPMVVDTPSSSAEPLVSPLECKPFFSSFIPFPDPICKESLSIGLRRGLWRPGLLGFIRALYISFLRIL
ncbi:hypothetical protein E1B28_011966 [Marasmius oreades]|uniref:Zn(2)-C6 fungal-type domain-containing protein n=1 Tax=Marasmius oreades TaxID=181124 RepID=A0A9P7UN66_9AGAR|nr:uncharacterized protein E1B28_011966 [Marasmius oreades]KAG7087918.1 hypothetical protein E1B28_011966 [Marasmius oreades]